MSSTYTWLDYSAHERRKMLGAVGLFGAKTTRDELGLGGVRDTFAYLLFAGTSTIQTRARYFLFAPWVYQNLEKKGVPSAQVASRARKLESSEAVALMTWEPDGFAYADCYDESGSRYRSLRSMKTISLPDANSSALLVKPEVALKQLEAETVRPPTQPPEAEGGGGEERPPTSGPTEPGHPPTDPPPKLAPTRFHGTVPLDAARVGRDAGRIAEEVIAHLSGQIGAKVRVTLEIDAEIPSGVSDQIVRIVTENSRTLKFTSQGFEKE